MVVQAMTDYMQQTGKTLGFLANKTGLDRSLLSKIANQSRTPSLDAGIKILKTCKASKEQILEFIDDANRSQSQSYIEVADAESKAKIRQDLALRLSKNGDLRDAFLDIADEGKEGISVSEIEYEYGKHIHSRLAPFIEAGVVTKEHDRYYALSESFHFDQRSSASLSESIVSQANQDMEVDSFVGDYSVEVCNLPKEGRMEVRRLLDKQKQEMRSLLKKYQMPTRKDAARVGITTMFTTLRGLLVICMVGGFLSLQDVNAGGISGGGTGAERVANNMRSAISPALPSLSKSIPTSITRPNGLRKSFSDEMIKIRRTFKVKQAKGRVVKLVKAIKKIF